MITVDTELGTITVAKSVIKDIILEVIDSFEGKVLLSNSKGKLPKFAYRIGTLEDSDHMEVELTEDGLEIRVFVVLRFGTSIKYTTNKIIGDLHSLIKERTGMRIANASVVVTGMLSKKIAPRHIEVRG